jgi:hypothetical protein
MNLPFERVGTHSTASLNSAAKMGTRWNASLPGSGESGAMAHQGDLSSSIQERAGVRSRRRGEVRSARDKAQLGG